MRAPNPISVVRGDGAGLGGQKSGVQKQRSHKSEARRRTYINHLIPKLGHVLKGNANSRSFRDLQDLLNCFANTAPSQHPQLDPALIELALSIKEKLRQEGTNTSATTANSLKELVAGLEAYHSTHLCQPLLQQSLETVTLLTIAQGQMHENTMGVLDSAVKMANHLSDAALYNSDKAHDKVAELQRQVDTEKMKAATMEKELARLKAQAITAGMNDAAAEFDSLRQDVQQANKKTAMATVLASKREQQILDLKREIQELRGKNDFLSNRLDVMTRRCDSLSDTLTYYGGYDAAAVRAVQSNPSSFPDYIWGKHSGAFRFVTTSRGVEGQVVTPLPDHIKDHQPSAYLLRQMASYYAMKERNPKLQALGTTGIAIISCRVG